MHATKAAVEEGIVAGGGVALLRASAVLQAFDAGRGTSRSASPSPLGPPRNRCAGSPPTPGTRGRLSSLRTKALTGNQGFNAQTEQYKNLVEAGMIDPTKVVRSALQNAASIASLLLTTEAVISQIPVAGPGASRAGRP